MKHAKDRLNKVIVIGANISGIAATNKLGELGIPVTLVDGDPDLDKKLSQDQWRLPSGVSFNYAHRPGLLRILRNPLIECKMPAEITSLKHTLQGFRAGVKTLQTFIDPDRCILCGRCVNICPVTTPDGKKPIELDGRRGLPGRPVIDKRRTPLCNSACPLGVNVQAYIALAGAGRFREALEMVRRDNVLPGICGRVCTHPCEASCRRGEMDASIAIRDIKRFLVDYENSGKTDLEVFPVPERSEKIAVIGSGPAGLAAAADLARFGYQVTVFEKEELPGGLLRYGIGPHRLPRKDVDYDLEYIKRLGVEFKTGHNIDLIKDLNRLKSEFDATILTTGIWFDRKIGMPGEELEGIEGCISFLSRLYRGEIKQLKEKAAVIGDGNAAFDLARVLIRLGADVTILSWFPKDDVPADEDEVKGAEDENISFEYSTQVVEFLGENGRLSKLRCKRTSPGKPDADGIQWPVIVSGYEPFDLEFDRAFVAIGQTGMPYTLTPQGLKLNDKGLVEVDESLQTSIPSVFAAGDLLNGPSTVVDAMASGRLAARSIHGRLSGAEMQIPGSTRPDDKDFPEIPKGIPFLARSVMPERQPAARRDDFSEVALGLSKTQVLSETERCLQCGVCSECFLCEEACGFIKAINHKEQSEESMVQTGVVIIADPKMAPPIKGEDVIRAYGPKAAKADVLAMITRGFDAAAKTVCLLESTFPRTKQQGGAFSISDSGLSPDIRIGVFICQCNKAFGWLDEMDEYVKQLELKGKEIVHVEVVPSACIPEGAADILRAIREKGITRVVLASCVCCPLDYICTACTNQRSRLKDALFNATGISRSMVETCDLRGEALFFLKHDTSAALARFTGLLDRSIQRAGKLKPLPSPVRSYNLTTAVIGNSEAAYVSARTLADAGLEVFMFAAPDKPVPKDYVHPNIHSFANSVVKSISGTLGNFQVFVQIGDFPQSLQVGAIILGERTRRILPYIHQEGLPGSIINFATQKRGITDIPFVYPGTCSIAGLFLADPPGIHVSERKKGSAAAVLAAAIMPRGPRQSKGYTVEIDKNRCRGCGRCVKACPYQAITFQNNLAGGKSAQVNEDLCKGCGNCISVCPSNAADSPYRDRIYLEQMLEEVLA